MWLLVKISDVGYFLYLEIQKMLSHKCGTLLYSGVLKSVMVVFSDPKLTSVHPLVGEGLLVCNPKNHQKITKI